MSSLPCSDGPATEERFSWLAEPGVWFWILCVIGLCLRLLLAHGTRGTTDADLWTEHAAGVNTHGLMGHYERDDLFNHPPFIAMVMAKLYVLADRSHIEFRVMYRSLIVLADMLNVWLLVRILANQPWRYLAAGLYAVAPIALVLAGMHGNTDTLVATCWLTTCLAVGRRNPIWAGVGIGIGAWIKLPALFLAPAFGFAFPNWRSRFSCAAVAIMVVASTYLPSVYQNPAILWQRIFGYRGMFISTTGEPPIWIWGFKTWFVRLFGANMADWPVARRWFRDHSHWVGLPLLILFGFLRRRSNDAHSLAITVAGSGAIFYAFTETWAFQYFAWSMPFWVVAGPRFGLAANLFGGGYIYGLYAFVCDDWLLRPVWQFGARWDWPLGLILLRDFAHATFVVFALVFLGRAGQTEWKLLRAGRTQPPAARASKQRRKSR